MYRLLKRFMGDAFSKDKAAAGASGDQNLEGGTTDDDLTNEGRFNPDEYTRKNPFNELQILIGHNNIVRLLQRIDDRRIASASDDGTIIIWDLVTARKLRTLRGHNADRPITCLITIEVSGLIYKRITSTSTTEATTATTTTTTTIPDHHQQQQQQAMSPQSKLPSPLKTNLNTEDLRTHTILLSGSADKTIKMWDVEKGTCIRTLEKHTSSVKCISVLDYDRFCSAGNDNYLCIWRNDGTLLHTIERQEQENINQLLPISRGRVVTSSNSSLLYVYDVKAYRFMRFLAGHRESVQCLIHISDDLFASASLDGSIHVWSSDTLSVLFTFNYVEKYYDKHMTYTHGIRDLIVIKQRFIGAALMNGIRVYDVETGECLVYSENETQSDQVPVSYTKLISLHDGNAIATCSEDGCIRLFDIHKHIQEHLKKHAPPSHPVDTSARSPTHSRASKFGSPHPSGAFSAPTTTTITNSPSSYASYTTTTRLHQQQQSLGGSNVATLAIGGSARIGGASGDSLLFQGNLNLSSSSSGLIMNISSSSSSNNNNNAVAIPHQNVIAPATYSKKALKGMAPVCFGELSAHTGAILNLLKISEGAFVSCGTDRMIMIWKDGRKESLRRNEVARNYLYGGGHHHRHSSSSNNNNNSVSAANNGSNKASNNNSNNNNNANAATTHKSVTSDVRNNSNYNYNATPSATPTTGTGNNHLSSSNINDHHVGGCTTTVMLMEDYDDDDDGGGGGEGYHHHHHRHHHNNNDEDEANYDVEEESDNSYSSNATMMTMTGSSLGAFTSASINDNGNFSQPTSPELDNNNNNNVDDALPPPPPPAVVLYHNRANHNHQHEHHVHGDDCEASLLAHEQGEQHIGGGATVGSVLDIAVASSSSDDQQQQQQ